MPSRHVPVRPDLDQLKHQAKDLLRAFRNGDPEAIQDFQSHAPHTVDPIEAKLADAQFVLARSYGVSSWPRLVLACNLIDAIWRDDLKTVKEMVRKHPNLITENARATESCNWGPPMSYAANVGRDEIIQFLHQSGATDHLNALGRAVLQSRIATATLLHELMGSPPPPEGALSGPAYTLSVEGTAFALKVGAQVRDAEGNRLAPVDVVLETDSRGPAKNQILEMYVQHGLELPDTPTMALHRGRIDLLEEHLRRDPNLLRRTFTHEEIYPPEMGCHDEVLATHGTPLAGTTLLHMCIDYDEWEIANWLIERGMDVNTPAEIDADGFGGHTALFGAVVCQPNFWMNYQGGWAHSSKPQQARFANLLLDHGADPNIRVSLRKQMHPGYGDDKLYEYRNVTPLEYGAQFSNQLFVSKPALEAIRHHMEKRPATEPTADLEALLEAILANDPQRVKQLIASHPDLVSQQVSTARLIERGKTHWLYPGDTALHLAAAQHRPELVHALLHAGANQNATHNHRNATPLHYAADGYRTSNPEHEYNQSKTIQVLFQAGSQIDAKDKNWAIPLHRAVRTRSVAGVRALLEAGSSTSAKNRSGSTPFHLAVQNTGASGSGTKEAKQAQREIIETFLAFGVSPTIEDSSGKSVLDWARSEWIRELLTTSLG